MRKNWKLAALPFLIAGLVPCQAAAQTAVPLEPSLLEWTWWVTDFAGKTADSEAPTFLMGEDRMTVTGKTACGNDWWATVQLDFPKITITDVQATAYDCAYAKEVTRFLTVLESANRFKTGREGLEILGKDGRRVLLMVSGG